jgi:hypothetical protein
MDGHFSAEPTLARSETEPEASHLTDHDPGEDGAVSTKIDEMWSLVLDAMWVELVRPE